MMFNEMNISASALTANRLRMDVVSSNIANANSTRERLVDGEWQPYRRKMVSVSSGEKSSFQALLQRVSSQGSTQPGNGVKVTGIVEDDTPFRLEYDPQHPDANEEGYVQLPNVDMTKEMTDLMSITRSYESNVTAFNSAKSMYMKALEIGR